MTLKLAPPPRPNTTRRHSTKTIALAREMYGDGDAWTPGEIQRYLARQGIDVAVTTVRRWVRPGVRERQNENNRMFKLRAKMRSEAPPVKPLGDRELDRRMLDLRDAGLAYSAIAVVVGVYHGAELTEDQVRYRLLKLGAAKNPRKARAARRAHVRAA